MIVFPKGYIPNTASREVINVSEGDEIGINYDPSRGLPKGALICFDNPVNGNSLISIYSITAGSNLFFLKPYETLILTDFQQLEGIFIKGVTDGILQNGVTVQYLSNSLS